MTSIKRDLNDRIKDIDYNIYFSLLSLFKLFEHNNKELFLVGGCVRDLLLGKSPKDYDLCTNATPKEVEALINNVNKSRIADHYHIIETGIKHGTVTVHDLGSNNLFEVTTYRVDGIYEDNRHPKEVIFTPSLEEDLKRRDFTINSFAYDLLKCELYMLDEYFIKDFKYKIIKTVGNANERFNEDALRMLRALRFSAQLGFTIETDTYEAIKQNASLLSNISKERIRDELTKILLSDNPQLLELFVVSGLEKYAFNGLTPLYDCLICKHENKHHYADVFHHTLDVIKRVPKKFELRWAALFHDIGKPESKREKEQEPGEYTYHGHPEISAEKCLVIMDILKFSNNQKELIYKYVKYHDAELVTCKNSKFKTILMDIGKENFLDFVQLRVADSYAHCLNIDTKYAIEYIDKLYARFDAVMTKEEALSLKDLKVNGYDMMDLGLKQKNIGKCLNYLFNQVLEDNSLNEKEKLLDLAKKFIEKENL